MDWFLYDIGLRHERVKGKNRHEVLVLEMLQAWTCYSVNLAKFFIPAVLLNTLNPWTHWNLQSLIILKTNVIALSQKNDAFLKFHFPLTITLVKRVKCNNNNKTTKMTTKSNNKTTKMKNKFQNKCCPNLPSALEQCQRDKSSGGFQWKHCAVTRTFLKIYRGVFFAKIIKCNIC